jgi:hypothetical protein
VGTDNPNPKVIKEISKLMIDSDAGSEFSDSDDIDRGTEGDFDY